MPNRYTRKLKPTLLSGDTLTLEARELFATITQLARQRLSSAHGWSLLEEADGDEGMIVECAYSDFRGTIELRAGADLMSVRGEGMLRTLYVLISLTCQDKRKVDAEIAEAKVEQGFEKVGSFIGAGVALILSLMFQVGFFRLVSLRVTAVFVFIGFFAGGMFGYLMGDQIADFLGRKSRVKTFDDQVDLGVARADWSDFIESVIEPIDAFAQSAEAVPSKSIVL